jgi:hypothetical protein
MHELNKWYIEESTNNNDLKGCFVIFKRIERDYEEYMLLGGHSWRTTEVYMCQDGKARVSCINNVPSPYPLEQVLASKESGYFKTFEEAQKVLKEFGR